MRGDSWWMEGVGCLMGVRINFWRGDWGKMFIFAQIFYSMKMKKSLQAFAQDYKRLQMDFVQASW